MTFKNNDKPFALGDRYICQHTDCYRDALSIIDIKLGEFQFPIWYCRDHLMLEQGSKYTCYRCGLSLARPVYQIKIENRLDNRHPRRDEYICDLCTNCTRELKKYLESPGGVQWIRP